MMSIQKPQNNLHKQRVRAILQGLRLIAPILSAFAQLIALGLQLRAGR